MVVAWLCSVTALAGPGVGVFGMGGLARPAVFYFSDVDERGVPVQEITDYRQFRARTSPPVGGAGAELVFGQRARVRGTIRMTVRWVAETPLPTLPADVPLESVHFNPRPAQRRISVLGGVRFSLLDADRPIGAQLVVYAGRGNQGFQSRVGAAGTIELADPVWLFVEGLATFEETWFGWEPGMLGVLGIRLGAS